MFRLRRPTRDIQTVQLIAHGFVQQGIRSKLFVLVLSVALI